MRFGLSIPIFRIPGLGTIRAYTGTNTKRRRPAPVFHHAGCNISHRTQGAADRCRIGR